MRHSPLADLATPERSEGSALPTTFRIQPDTRKLLTTGLSILAIGATCAASVTFLFGGYTPHGPTTNGGWLALVFALGCVPTGLLTLLLAILKLIGDARR